jgi:hypothetical protein
MYKRDNLYLPGRFYRLFLVLLAVSTAPLLLSSKPVVMRSIQKTTLYSNFTGGLFPLRSFGLPLVISKDTKCRLIGERYFTNGLFGSILELEIVEGPDSGRRGFAFEEYFIPVLDRQSLPAPIVFTVDIDHYNGLIKDETRAMVTEMQATGGEPKFLVELQHGSRRGEIIEIHGQDLFRFVTGFADECSYQLSRGRHMLRVLDGESLLPVADVQSSKRLIEAGKGIYFITGKKVQTVMISAPGYAPRYVNTGSAGQMHLVVLNRFREIRFYDDRQLVFDAGPVTLVVPAQTGSVMSTFRLAWGNTFGSAGLEPIDLPGTVPVTALYLEGLPAGSAFQSSSGSITVFKRDRSAGRWKVHSSGDLVDGLYCITVDGDVELKELQIQYDHRDEVVLYIRDKERTMYRNIVLRPERGRDSISARLQLPTGTWETVAWSSGAPSQLHQDLLYVTTSGQKFVIPALAEPEDSMVQQLNHYYHGIWKREGIEVADKEVEGGNSLEFLGDMKLEKGGAVTFSTGEVTLKGMLTITGEGKCRIDLSAADCWIENRNDGAGFRLSPSKFDTSLFIPARYSFYTGIFQVSFNTIYYYRKKLAAKESEEPMLYMESFPWGRPVWPSTEKECRYKLYFTQQ